MKTFCIGVAVVGTVTGVGGVVWAQSGGSASVTGPLLQVGLTMLGAFGSLLVTLMAAAVVGLFKVLKEFREFKVKMLIFKSDSDGAFRRNGTEHAEMRQELEELGTHPQECRAYTTV